MAWIAGHHHPQKDKAPLAEELYKVKGKLDDDEARKWFVKFCMANLSFATNILIGVKLAPIQEIKLRSFFLRNFILDIEGRGSGKSFVVAVFIVLYALFNPGVRIGICSATFRQSKMLFRTIEKFSKDEKGKLFKQCIVGDPIHSADLYEMQIGRSVVVAVPLTEKIRGLRFNVVVLDELMLIPNDIIDNVIIPFLSASQDGMENKEIFDAETKLIAAGRLTEAQRTKFPSNKVIGMSSASFKFEPLYKDYYEKYMDKILDEKETGVNHALIKFSYEIAPPGLMNMEIIEDARSRNSKATFDREYRAIFTDDASGFFSVESINRASLRGNDPTCIRLKGLPDKKYILSIDPNYNQSDTSDHFAMAVFEINEENESVALVHSYALANSKLGKRSLYFKYILESFNIVYIIADNAGGPEFISDVEQFLGKLPQPIIRFEDTFLDGEEGIREARKAYNPNIGKMFHSQIFGQKGWYLTANMALQADLEHGKMLFAAPIFNEATRLKMLKEDVPIHELEFAPQYDKMVPQEKMHEFIDHQNYLLDLTKKELTLIEVKANATGHHSFDLPKNLKITDDVNRARKDSYTTLLLGCWAARCYFEMKKMPEKRKSSFKPCFVA